MSASRQKKLRKETTQPASAPTKQKRTEEQKLKTWSVIFYIVIAAMVIGLLVAAFMTSGIVHRLNTAAVIGEHKLSAADVNYYFNQVVSGDQFLPYVADSTKPLDEQFYDEEKGITFADHYMDQALEAAKAVYAIYDEAVAANFTNDGSTAVEDTKSSLQTYSKLYGYPGINSFLRANYGIGCNWNTYKEYIEVSELAAAYAAHISEGLTATADEIAAEVAENPTDYSAYSYAYVTLSYSDFYGDDHDHSEEGHTHTEEQNAAAKEAALKEAEKMAQEVDGDTEAMLALENVKEANDVAKSSIPADLREWVSEDGRKEGEVYTVEGASGNICYVAMFLGSHDNSEVLLRNVRHILISPEGEQGADGSYTEEQMAAAKEEAQKILDGWKSGEATEDAFASLANKNSDDGGSNTTGGLYENVHPGQMVAEFEDWCFDETRKAGDTGLVETTYGVHIMYYVGESEENYRDHQAEHVILEEKYNTWYDAAVAKLTVTRKGGMKMVHTSIYVQQPSQTAY